MFVPSVCPHDCPSTCALEVERLDEHTIGRVRGVAGSPYWNGVICAKVSRYAERAHHPDRLDRPLRRVGAKGSGRFEPISWENALDMVAEAFVEATSRNGPQTVWPFLGSGSMGLVQRDSVSRLRHVMGYSGCRRTYCSAIASPGWEAGVGARRGLDPREMPEADLVVLWGINAVHTQIQIMELAKRARKERDAKIVVIDPYRTRTAAQADIHLAPKPGTDGALACAVMHVLFREGYADRDYMAAHTDQPDRLEHHLETRTPAWAAEITGLGEDQIVAFARLYGETKRSFLRLGHGFSRSRNGAVNMHAASCLAAVTGAWQYPGGGGLFSNGGLFALDTTLIEGTDVRDPAVRILDTARIGPVLCGDEGGPPVTAMLVQGTNPAAVAPESGRVRAGLLRDDLFLCVHEQFMTDTAALADVVLPATTFLEHDDIYAGGNHTFLQVARKIIEPFAEARPSHDVVRGLARRLGAEHPGFLLSDWELVDATLRASGFPGADALHAAGWHDCALDFEDAHFLGGFPTADGRFHFAPGWGGDLPALPDHVALIEEADAEHPFRLITPPSRHYLNSSFTQSPTAIKREGRPCALIHPGDFARLGLVDGGPVRLGNRRGSLVVHAEPFDGGQQGVVVVESVWPGTAFPGGIGINLLVGADLVAPAGGAAYHDTAVWVRPA